MKSVLSRVIVLFAVSFGPAAHATPLTYDITVTSDHWVSVQLPAFGLSGNPTLNGQIEIDNAYTGRDAFKSFWFTTGTHTWTLDEFVGPIALVYFDHNGYLDQFSLDGFVYGDTKLYIHSNQTTNIYGNGNFFFCNACVSFEVGEPVAVPGPASLGLMGIGILAIGYALRRRSIGVRDAEKQRRK